MQPQFVCAIHDCNLIYSVTLATIAWILAVAHADFAIVAHLCIVLFCAYNIPFTVFFFTLNVALLSTSWVLLLTLGLFACITNMVFECNFSLVSEMQILVE